LRWFRFPFESELGDDFCIDFVGLVQDTFAFGEVTDVQRIGNVDGNVVAGKGKDEFLLVMTGRFAQHELDVMFLGPSDDFFEAFF